MRPVTVLSDVVRAAPPSTTGSEEYGCPDFPTRLRSAVAERGAIPVAAQCARWGARYLVGLPWSVRGRRGAFEFGGEQYPLLAHRHNWTWLNERAVEVPLIQRLVDRHSDGRVLEIGNVLSHYRPQRHLVVDKYEHAPHVLAIDAMELTGVGPFDLIVAISTIEHIGWDEHPRDPFKAVAAIRHLAGLLAPGGMLVITVPVGYNDVVEEALIDGSAGLTELRALRRIAPQTWLEVPPATARQAPYDTLFQFAGGLLVGRLQRAGGRRIGTARC